MALEPLTGQEAHLWHPVLASHFTWGGLSLLSLLQGLSQNYKDQCWTLDLASIL